MMSSRMFGSSTDSSSSDNELPGNENTRSSRTVFICNLPYNLSKEDIIDHFSRSGEIANICLFSRSITGNHSGKCLIEFKNTESAQNALQLNGQSLLGQPLYVTSSHADSFRVKGQKYSNPSSRYVRISRRNRDDSCEGFNENNGRFKGGFLLSEDFKSDFKPLPKGMITPAIPESKPAFPCRFSAMLFQSTDC